MYRVLDNYLAGDELATAILPDQFHRKLVDLGGATEFLKRPSIAKSTLLNKHQVQERMALKMPCCDCVQTSYTCEGKNSQVVFEHTEKLKDWYGRRPQIHTECAGKSCCLVELGTTLIATWPIERGYPLRELFDALRYVVKTGCQWRFLPHDFPPWTAVYQQARRWNEACVFEQAAHDLRETIRMTLERGPHPTVVVMDGRTLQSTPESGGWIRVNTHRRSARTPEHRKRMLRYMPGHCW